MTSEDLKINDAITVEGREEDITLEIVNITPNSIGYRFSGMKNVLWKTKDDFDEIFKIKEKIKEGDGKYCGKGKRANSPNGGLARKSKKK